MPRIHIVHLYRNLIQKFWGLIRMQIFNKLRQPIIDQLNFIIQILIRQTTIHHLIKSASSIIIYKSAYEAMKEQCTNSTGNHSQYKQQNQNSYRSTQNSYKHAEDSYRYNAYQNSQKNNKQSSNFYQNFWEFDEIFEEQSTQNQEESYQMDQKQFKTFQRAFNSFLRHGYLKKKYRRFQSLISQLFLMTKKSNFSFTDLEAQNFTQFYKSKPKQKKPKASGEKKSKLDIKINLTIQLSQLGTDKLIEYQREVACSKCAFERENNYKKVPCQLCHKTGLNDYLKKCKNCEGRGFTVKYDCKSCHNTGSVIKRMQEIVSIPSSINNGQKIKVQGRGNQNSKNGNYGNLIMTITLENCSNGQNSASNSASEIYIDIFTAVLGGKTAIETKNGRRYIQVPAGTQDGQKIPGYRTKGEFGSTVQSRVKVNIKIPNLSLDTDEKTKKIYQKLRQIRKEKLHEDS